MSADDKKHSGLMLAMMLGKKKADKPDDEEPEAEDEGDPGSEGLHSAMEDFLAAVHKSDPAAMAEAFKDAVCCADDDSGDEPEEDDKEESKPLGMTIRR